MDAQPGAAGADHCADFAQDDAGDFFDRMRAAEQFADGVQQVDFLVACRQLGAQCDGGAFGFEDGEYDRKDVARDLFGTLPAASGTISRKSPGESGRASHDAASPCGAARGARRRGGRTRDQLPTVTVEPPQPQRRARKRTQRREDAAEFTHWRGSVIQMVFPWSLKATSSARR